MIGWVLFTLLFSVGTLGFVLLARKELHRRVDHDYEVIGVGRPLLDKIERVMAGVERRSGMYEKQAAEEIEPRLLTLEGK